MNEIKIKKPVFIGILVGLVVVVGALIGLVIYDTLEINNLKSATPQFTNGEMRGPGMNGGNPPDMNGEMPEFNGEAPELPDGETPEVPEGGNVTDSSSDSASNSSKPNRGTKSSSSEE